VRKNNEPEMPETEGGTPSRGVLYRAVMNMVADEMKEFEDVLVEARQNGDTSTITSVILARGELKLRGIVTAEQVRNLSSVLMRDALGGIATRLAALPGSRKAPAAVPVADSDDQGPDGTEGGGA
jgi:hypothetical protein